MQSNNPYDIEEIGRALSLMVRPEQLVELRVLKTSQGTQAGYFTDLGALAQAAASFSGKAPGVYITLNPVAPCLLARSDNRVGPWAKHTANEKDIVSRQLLGIDFDPVRPSDISATDAEHEAALKRADECRQYLTGLDWPEPIYADSGNGGHLVYAIDLPNDKAATELVKKVLLALDLLFTSGAVKVDQAVSNASRIWKLYGTLAAKGDNTPVRPHRLSRILSHPDSLIPISIPLLEELAAKTPTNPINPANPVFGRRGRGGRRVDVAKWIEECGVPFLFDGPWEKHHKWVMQCPWNPEHTNKSAFIIQFGDGGVMARCLHNSCEGKGWPELQDIYEPDWREKEQFRTDHDVPYQSTEKGLVWLKQTSTNTVPVPLTNFDARITKQITLDDGLETARTFQIEANLEQQSVTITVPSSQFSNMNWVTEQLGAKAIVYPGSSLRDHARAAIQCLSQDMTEERIYTHTGWTFHAGEHIYLHGGGALGRKGNVDGVQTKLDDCLAPFHLSVPTNKEEGLAAVQASLQFLNLAPDYITFPLYAALWRSVISTCDFSVFLAGQTGTGKSELGALLEQHFGPGFTARKLPTAWTSTSNSNEALAFIAKDMLLVVDDFVLTGGQNDIARTHKEADRLLRAQGNNAGRGRMRADATLRPAKPPRGLILVTGEDLPRGSSLQARLLIVELAMKHLDWAKLTECQGNATAGLFAQAMAMFIIRLSHCYDTVLEELRREVQEYRKKAVHQARHKRTPDIIANLAFGLKKFLQFASAIGAIAEQEATALEERGWQAFGEAAVAQGSHQVSQDPVERFFSLLHAAILTDKAYLADDGYQSQEERRERIGWKVEECGEIYEMLEPETAFRVASQMAQQQGEALSISKTTLWKRLRERGLVAKVDSDRNLYSWHLQSERVRVVCLRAGTIQGGGREEQALSPDKNRDLRDETDFPFGFNLIERPDSVQ